MAYRLGVDSGGTFTDVVLFNEDSGKLSITKTPSTPANPSIGVHNGIEKILRTEKADPKDISSLIHGTTVATNTLLEYKGAKTALLLTRGFKDILSIVRQDRPKMYDYFEQRPAPLIPRELRFEVGERILYNGEILELLNESDVQQAISAIKDMGITTVAVCLLHSYVNPKHELHIKELFRKRYPEATVSLSCEILPEIREYERMSTTTINAYVMPIIERYLGDLVSRLTSGGLDVSLNVMQSNGGIMPSSATGQKSVATILSGPAGGVLGSHWIAKLAGLENIITIDMGGTSADISLIASGKYHITKESEIGGHAIKIPMIDINTIGAGGGSIAWIDTGGLLRVGPQSAGASPGPACYGIGGVEPTVTDANLVLGRLNPHFYVGGEMPLDVELAKEAVKTQVANPLGLSLEEAAEGILEVVNANMTRGIRRVSVERGHDLRHFCMFAFGGGGPLHAADLASGLNIPKILIPISPGVNSAVGLLIADFRYDYSKTFLTELSSVSLQDLNRQYGTLEDLGLRQMLGEKIKRENIIFNRSADMRYAGQGYEIEIPVPQGELGIEQINEIKRAFHDTHASLYGYRQDDAELEFVYLRLAVVGTVKKPGFYKEPLSGEDASPAFKETRKVFIGGTYIDTPVYDRTLLRPNNRLEGPAVVEQLDSTTLLKSGQTAKVDEYFNLIIDISE
jgi:N-methylhydantoinase A